MNIQKNNGMVLHLYKHLDGSMFDDIHHPASDSDSERTMIAFGNFDQLCFEPVDRFVEFLSQSSDAYRWRGGRKDIMLYPLEADEHRHFVFETKQSGYVQPPFIIREGANAKDPCKRRFLLITLLYVSSKAKAHVKSYNSLLDHIKNAIHTIVSQSNNVLKESDKNPIICDIFGTFNSSEIALLWAADQFTDVQYIVDHIRYLHLECGDIAEPIFVSSYTLVALTKDASDLDDITGGAMIQIASSTFRFGENVKDFTGPLDYLINLPAADKLKIDCCAGEYDYIVESLPPQLQLLLNTNLKSNDGSLHVDNKEFKNLFSHSTTRLFYRAEDIPNALMELNWRDMISLDIPEREFNLVVSEKWKDTRVAAGAPGSEISQRFKDFKEKMLSEIQGTSTFSCNIDLLFSDYIQCVNSTPDRQWAEDLKAQFAATIDVLEEYYEDYKRRNSGARIDQCFLDQVNEVLSMLDEQIHHVADAGKLFLEEPCSHLEATSQYDLLFHMYYGAAKSILSTMYSSREAKAVSTQSSLIPLISFDPGPSLRSKLYFDIPKLNQRLVDLSVPKNAWCEPGQYIILLIHELYHYAAPLDRTVRNEAFAKIIINEVITISIQRVLEHIRETVLEQKKATGKSLTNYNQLFIATVSDSEFNASLFRVIHQVRGKLISYIKTANITKFLGAEYSKDAQWRKFEKIASLWCDGADGYNRSTNNFGCFVSKIIDYLGKELKPKTVSTKVEPIDDELYNIIIYELTSTVSDNNYQHFKGLNSFTEYIRAAKKALWGPAVKQLREIAPDIAMVHISGINVTEYMLVFASFQDKTLIEPNDLRCYDAQLAWRIGFVLDFIINQPKLTPAERLMVFQQYETEFRQKYIAHVKVCRWSGRNEIDKLEISAGKWFSYFIDQYEDYLANYEPYHEILRSLAKDQFVPLCQNNDKKIATCSRDYFDALSKINPQSEDADQQEIFKCNIGYVHSFQPQSFLFDLHVSPPKNSALTSRNTLRWHLPNFHTPAMPHKNEDWAITRAKEHSEPIALASGLLTNTHYKVFGTKPEKCELWYRGSQNSDYGILPSIMVHFLDKERLSYSISENNIKGVNSKGNLWEYQRSILERFKNKADGAPEFINSSSYTASDYVALMQHYGQYTCYLDWSEDVYTALFFALESEIELKKSKSGGSDASLYILDPMLYNRARKMLIERARAKEPELFCPNDTWMRKQANRIQEMPDGHIPNLSLQYNQDRFGIFSFDIPENEDVTTSRTAKYLTCEGDPKDATLAQFELELWNLPLAVYTSRLNPRLRSQSGQFMAYSPFSLPVYSTTHEKKDISSANRFSYLSLLKIQDYFLECFREEEPFMYEVKIRAFAREAMGDYLRKAGINRYRIYPELINLKKF